MRKWLNSDKVRSVTEVGSKDLAERILKDMNSKKHNPDKIVEGKESNYYELGGDITNEKFYYSVGGL